MVQQGSSTMEQIREGHQDPILAPKFSGAPVLLGHPK